jgi:hypothetical protein
MKKARAEKPAAKILRPLNPEECRRIQGGLAFPFIQQAMDDSPDSGG